MRYLLFFSSLFLAACSLWRPSEVKITQSFLQEAKSMGAQQQYERGLAFRAHISSDSDRNNVTRWLCAAAFQDFPKSYYALAQFYMGIQEDAHGEINPVPTTEENKNKFNVALGAAFLLLAKDNKKDSITAQAAARLYKKVIMHIGVKDAYEAQRYRGIWINYQEKMRQDGFSGLSYYLYDTLPCFWGKAG